MDTPVDILATGEIALLGRLVAEIIERHGAGLTQFADQEVRQRRQLRCAGLGTALLSLRCGSRRHRMAIDLRRCRPTILLSLWRGYWRGTALRRGRGLRGPTVGRKLGNRSLLTFSLGHRRALVRFGRRRWTALLLLRRRRRTTLVISLGLRPAVRHGLRRRAGRMLSLRRWAALILSFCRRTAMLLRLTSRTTGMLCHRLWAALVLNLTLWATLVLNLTRGVAIGLGLRRCGPVVTVILSNRTTLLLRLRSQAARVFCLANGAALLVALSLMGPDGLLCRSGAG